MNKRRLFTFFTAVMAVITMMAYDSMMGAMISEPREGNEVIMDYAYNPTPEDGATGFAPDEYGLYHYSFYILPSWSGELNFFIKFSTTPDMKTIAYQYTLTVNCNASLGEKWVWDKKSFFSPGTTYYWQLSLYHFDVESFLIASPVWSFTTAFTGLRGDVDGDGDVNISDVTALIDYLLTNDASNINLNNADCNQDSSINISDVTALIDYLLSGSWN